MKPVNPKNISLNEKDILDYLFKSASNYYVSRPHRLSWKSEHNLLISSLANKKFFNDMFCTFQILNHSQISYQGKWFKTFNSKSSNTWTVSKSWFNTSTYNILKNNVRCGFVLDNILLNPTNLKTNVFSLVSAQFNKPDRATIWFLIWDSHLTKGIYNVFKTEVRLTEIAWHKYFPYYLNVDSEYCDKVKDNTLPYHNKRDRFPVSITATSINIYSFKKKTHHYIFDAQHLKYLEPYKNSDDMCVSEYNESHNLCTNEHITFKLIEKTPFFCFLCQIYANVFPTSTSKDYELFLSPESHTRLDKNFKKNSFIIHMNFFWSAKDLRYWFGYVAYMYMEPLLSTKSNSVTFEKHRIKSRFGFILKNYKNNMEVYIIVQLNDISRLSERGLEDLANVSNVSLSIKHSVDKINITNTLKKTPSLYLDYCRDDTQNLDTMTHNMYVNLLELYEMFNIKNIPSYIDFSPCNSSLNYMRFTSGSNCSKFFEEYIYSLDVSMKSTLNLLSIKAGDNTQIDGINMGSARYLNYLGSHASIGAFVSGGRTITERIEKNYKNGADVDLSSAYSNSIKSQMYCVGIPSVVRPIEDTFTNEEGQVKYYEPFIGSLNDVLKTYRKNFIPGCWMMIVSTIEPLSFKFDLIVSKNISQKTTKYTPETSTNNTTVPGEQFVLLHEIKNGVLEQSALEIIDNVATRNEKRELYKKIHVKEIVYYDKRNKCETTEEFNFKVCTWFTTKHQRKLKRKGGRPRLNKDTVGIGSKKNKPPYWFGIKMDLFMDKLIKIRKEYQKLYKETNNPMYESKQRSIKNFCNMLYGSSASKYFNISNLVFANNITGLCRSAVWIMAKSLNLTQTVTDGGTMELYNVNHYHLFPLKHKPGFNILASNALLQNSSFIKPLGFGFPINWENHLKKTSNDNIYRDKVCKVIDKLINQHVNKFINYYRLEKSRVFPYSIETKSSNLFFKCANLGRGHYALQRTDNTFLFKVRGTQQKEGNEHVRSPIFDMLLGKMFNKDVNIQNLTYTKSILVKSHDLNHIRTRDPSIKLHDAFVQLMCIRVKCDCGKYAYFENFTNTTRKTFEKEHYSFLNPSYFNTNQRPCVLRANYWEYYHNTLYNKCLNKLDTTQINKRFSKANKEDFVEMVENANKCDPNFKHIFTQNIQNDYKDDIKKDEDNLDNSNDPINDIPALSDDEKDMEMINFI